MTAPKSSIQQLTWEDVLSHNEERSVWVVVHGKVYDVTAFLASHPGGPDILLQFAGKDGTEAWEDAGHSKDARQMMQQYCIGNVAGERPVSLAAAEKEKHGHGHGEKKKDCVIM
ncbi:uncharacterized protein LOC129586570 [Paramacrobiotus metropolitanus]|uniref:uncharacterized protein LOC129586570 n=1 Tax=Paramacrobiotus metropolitanus TaxID=2943436 RepID=UPI002445B6EC|nr:uncharacterized protein LOC129586570 [Paramacrobiotus metropolitanus]